MPADLFSTVILILLRAAEALGEVWPWVLGGVAVAGLLSRTLDGLRWRVPAWLPGPLAVPLAAVLGAASPLPTTGTLPLALRLQAGGLPTSLVLTFVLSSSLLNPQLFLLTMGTLGARFALAQLAGVLLLSIGLGLALGWGGNRWTKAGGDEPASSGSTGTQLLRLLEHVGFYVLLGMLAGAGLQVLLPRLGVLGWLGARGWLSSPLLGWLGAPFYTCGGAAVPLAGGLARIGFSRGVLFTFLLVGPALRGTALANLGCLLSRRALVVCLVTLALAGSLLGYLVDGWLSL